MNALLAILILLLLFCYIFSDSDKSKNKPVCTGFTTADGEYIFEGDTFRQKLEDKMEPEGFFWWYCVVKRHENGAWVLCQIDFDYSNSPFEEYALLIDECKKIEFFDLKEEKP